MHSLLLISTFLVLTGRCYGHTGDLHSLTYTNPGVCIALHCPLESAACVLEPECRETLECMTGCEGRPDVSQCQFECEMTLGLNNEVFITLLRCMAEHDCFPEVPPDGICLAGPEDTVQEITTIDQVSGDWWVVSGVNCGQDDVWTGGYDWYPCQHERYLRFEDGWINNTTYCGGKESVCTTGQIVTIPHATMPSPGLIRLEYDDEPLLPQIERWHIVGVSPWPQPQWMFVMWCGQNPALDYNGAFVLSRGRVLSELPEDTETVFRDVALRHGVDWEGMCESDNTGCPESP